MDITWLFSLNSYTFNPLALANFLFMGVLFQLALPPRPESRPLSR